MYYEIYLHPPVLSLSKFSSNVKTILAAEAEISTRSTPRSWRSAMLLALKSLLVFCLDNFEPETFRVSNREREITLIN